MASKSSAQDVDAKGTQVDLEIKSLQAQKRDADKRIKELRLGRQLLKDIDTWKEIQALKGKILKQLQSIDGCKTWNLTKMMKTPTYFVYQNPGNMKEKAADDAVGWVVAYKKKNGSLAAATKRAQESQITIAKKIFGRIKKRKKKTFDPTDYPGKKAHLKELDARGRGVV